MLHRNRLWEPPLSPFLLSITQCIVGVLTLWVCPSRSALEPPSGIPRRAPQRCGWQAPSPPYGARSYCRSMLLARPFQLGERPAGGSGNELSLCVPTWHRSHALLLLKAPGPCSRIPFCFLATICRVELLFPGCSDVDQILLDVVQSDGRLYHHSDTQVVELYMSCPGIDANRRRAKH